MPMKTYAEAADFMRLNEIGRDAFIETPYGRRLLCQADLTATGRILHLVEAWMQRAYPFYANTHTTISSSGRITTELREEARRVVLRAVNAGPDDLAVFVGSGVTSAINKLVGLLGLRISEPLERELQISRNIPAEKRPIVFVGPYEHHSNELPWLESVAELVEVPLDGDGAIDLADLERKLQEHSARPLKIGSFSAASNVTGVLTDVPAVARVLHRHGAIACFDFAAAGPHVPIDMHPPDPDARIDAIFLSMHKFLGGPQASGVLVANRGLFRTRTPERPGGGTVDYVSAGKRLHVDYVQRLDEREEGGTPAILGDVRAGVAFLVRDILEPKRILAREIEVSRIVVTRLSRHRRIMLLGPTKLPRLAIFSFNIERLHHNLVSELLDQLFGIQTRAGCSCAAPYGHRLLNIDEPTSAEYRRLVARGVIGIKPGWVRLSLPHYAAPMDIEFILSAIEFVAEHGRDFIPVYRLSWRDAVWRHLEKPGPDFMPMRLTTDALEAVLRNGHADSKRPTTDAMLAEERSRYFSEAKRVTGELHRRWRESPPRWNPGSGDPDVDRLAWFDYVHSEDMPR